MDQAAVMAVLDDDTSEEALASLASGARSVPCPGLGDGRLVFPRYREARRILREPVFRCAPMADGFLASLPSELREDLSPMRSWALYSDPPQHLRLRALLAKAFTPRRIRALEAHVSRLVEELIGSFVDEGGGDAVEHLAVPLPVLTISALLGVPKRDRDWLKARSDDLILIIEPSLTTVETDRVAGAWRHLWAYFSELVERRRARPGADVISGMLKADEQGRRLTAVEIVSNTISLLLGGHETTTNLISGLILAASRYPEHRRAVAEDPAVAAGFVEEVLRMYGPSKMTARVALADTDLDGSVIPAGQRVVVLLASANRDPEAFSAAHSFHPDRYPNPHLAFGYGPHTCFGAALARMQARAFLVSFVRRGVSLTVDAERVRWKNSRVLRSVEFLPMVSDGDRGSA